MGKKICMFAANYLPHVGGIENYTYHLSKELIAMGHSITVVTSHLYDNPVHEFDEGIEIYRMPCYSLIGDRYPVCKVNKEFKEIDKELENHNFDLIIIHARFYFHSIYAAKFAKKHNIKCFTIEHGSSHLSVNNKLLDFLGGIWEHGITAVLKKYCEHYFAACILSGEWSKHFKITSEGLLYNSVDFDDINEKKTDRICDYRKDYGISLNDVVITFTGRIIPEKGVPQLVNAFKELDLKNVYLFIAGDGPLLNELKKNSFDRIILLGAIDFSHIIALLDGTDIYCLPSVSEALSTSILEAIATKTFVITTERGGAAEIITDDSYGIIMKSNSVEEIKAAIVSSLDKNYRESCAKKCYKRLAENFTWKKTAEKVIEIMEII